jgi:transcription-repair coupling factor (superfamily II helicase)
VLIHEKSCEEKSEKIIINFVRMDNLYLPDIYRNDERVSSVLKVILQSGTGLPAKVDGGTETVVTAGRKIGLKGLAGSGKALVCGVLASNMPEANLFILRDKEQAAYFHNDLLKIFNGQEQSQQQSASPHILFFPSSCKHSSEADKIDNESVLQRAEVLNRLRETKNSWVVTYPEAVEEKVITPRQLAENTVKIHINEPLSQDFLIDFLDEYGFRSVDFVAEPGEYAIRGGIIDIYSYSNDLHYRMEMDC